MRTQIFIAILIAFLGFNVTAHASSPLLFGFSAGPAFVWNSDFNNQNTRSNTHAKLGVNVLCAVNCRRNGFCNGLFGEISFDAVLPANSSFGATRIFQTGVIGNFSKSISSYSAGFSLRKNFFPDHKWQLSTSLGLGANYLKINQYQFQDTLGNSLNLNLPTQSWRAETQSGFGITYKISNKLMVDIIPRLHLPLASDFDGFFIEIPLSVKYAL